MTCGRTFKIAVLGSARESEDSDQAGRAFSVGREVAVRGAVLLTGGCPGLPHAAVRGAHSMDGLTVAVSPAMNLGDHSRLFGYPSDSRVILYTGMGTKGRNVVLVRSADACIFIGGGMGTLNEFTIAFDELGPECAIGILEESGGFADEFLRIASCVGRSPAARIMTERDPARLVEKVFEHISSDDD